MIHDETSYNRPFIHSPATIIFLFRIFHQIKATGKFLHFHYLYIVISPRIAGIRASQKHYLSYLPCPKLPRSLVPVSLARIIDWSLRP